MPFFATEAINIYAKEKVRLRKKGTPVDDIDLFNSSCI
jgi:hypothetical protein